MTRAQEALQHQEDKGTAEEGTGGGRRHEAGINENKQQSAKDVERHCAAAGERTLILEGGDGNRSLSLESEDNDNREQLLNIKTAIEVLVQ